MVLPFCFLQQPLPARGLALPTKFCRESTADVDAIRFCLLEHKDELSGACEARLQDELGAVGETHSDN